MKRWRLVSFFFNIWGHFLFFLCFASVQNCETYPPARGQNKQVLKTKLSCMLYGHETTKIWSISFINKGNTQEKMSKEYFRTLQDHCIHNFKKEMYSVDIFLCLFCNCRGSKPTCTRTKKQRKTKKWPSLFCKTFFLWG
jgi:hypothetical protein